MATIWTDLTKPEGTGWTDISRPSNEIPRGSPIAAGFFLYLTYADTIVKGWNDVEKASGTTWGDVSKASGTSWTDIQNPMS